MADFALGLLTALANRRTAPAGFVDVPASLPAQTSTTTAATSPGYGACLGAVAPLTWPVHLEEFAS